MKTTIFCILFLNTVVILGGQTSDSGISAVQTIGVAGASNATPSLAASGPNVALVWTAAVGTNTNVYVAVSRDGGATFSGPTRVNDKNGDAGATNEQPPRVVLTGSAARPTITVLWSKRDSGSMQTRNDTMMMARSTDGGRTFSPAHLAHSSGVTGARGWESLTAAPDGTLHAVWLDGRDAARKIADAAAHGHAHQGQPPQDVYHGTLTADGRMVESLIATDVCFCCKTALALDRHGDVYAAWRHVFPGSMRDIAFAKSSDGGRNFSPLIRVSADNWELNGCPEDGPSLAVDDSGTIHIAWSTVVTDGEPRKAIFYSTSRNGKTFSPRKRLPTAGNTTPGHPQLALTSDGGAAIVFDEVADGVRRVALARVSPSGVFQPAHVLSGQESATYPVLARGGSDLLVAWTSRRSGGQSSDPSQIRLTRVTP